MSSALMTLEETRKRSSCSTLIACYSSPFDAAGPLIEVCAYVAAECVCFPQCGAYHWKLLRNWQLDIWAVNRTASMPIATATCYPHATTLKAPYPLGARQLLYALNWIGIQIFNLICTEAEWLLTKQINCCSMPLSHVVELSFNIFWFYFSLILSVKIADKYHNDDTK